MPARDHSSLRCIPRVANRHLSSSNSLDETSTSGNRNRRVVAKAEQIKAKKSTLRGHLTAGCELAARKLYA
jgi:hypothetical protein